MNKPIAKLAAVAASIMGLGLPAAAVAQNAAPYRIVESGRQYQTLQSAVDAIGDRGGTILIAPGTYRDCAVQDGGNITYRAAKPGAVTFDGGVCEGKATLVLGGQSASVEGIIFRNISVADGNGAGIRLEDGNLNVSNATFLDSEQGILTADNPAGSIRIARSTFSGLGRCDRGLSCAHSIYLGNYGKLTVIKSRFERGHGGHYVKSRARLIEVLDSSFDDVRGRTTTYMVDLPEGASGRIAGNFMVQGRDKENYSAFVAVGAEDRTHSSAGLVIENNDAKLALGLNRSTVFLANWTNDRIALRANRLGPNLTPYEAR